MRDEETAHFRAHLMTEKQFMDKVGYMPSKSDVSKDEVPLITNKTWKKVGELIMRWAQDDGTGDELQDLVSGERESGMNDEEWAEFEARLKKAFG